jgi:hypothetical protein
MSASDILLNLFLADDGSPEQEAAAEEAGDLSSEEILDAMPEVADQLPPEQAAVVRAAYGLEQPEGAPEVPAEIADQLPPLPDDASPAEMMAHYNTVIDMTHDDGDTYIDQSVNQNIEAFGDVNQSFEQSAVTGDGAVVAGDDSQVNTGDGAVQAGGDVSDSTVGDGNTSVEDSVMNESSLTGDVSSDETSVSASGGSSLAFGEGSTAAAEGDTTVGENYGNFAGEGDLDSDVDNSLNDSFNTEGSGNSDNLFEDNSTSSVFSAEDSFNADNSVTDGSSDDDWSSTSDDDTTYEDNSTTSDSSAFSSSFSSDDDTSFADNSTSSDSSSYDESYSSDDDASFEDSSTSAFDFGGS